MRSISRGTVAAATIGSTVLLSSLFSSAVHAGAFALREQSAYGQGSSFAGIAAGGSLSAMFWNPATLNIVDGFQTESVHTAIFANSDVTLNVVDSSNSILQTEDAGNIGGWAYVPSGYAAMRLREDLVLGVGINGPFGLATKYDLDSVARTRWVAGTSQVFSLNVNPNLAYQINDKVTVAAGLQVQYMSVRYTDFVTAGGLTDATLSGDGINFGFTAGIHVKASKNTEFGIGYRSGVRNKFGGRVSGRDSNGAEVDSAADAVVATPDMVTIGISHRINDSWKVLAGVEWTNWSILKSAPVDVASISIADFAIPFNYVDGWYFSLGTEYEINEHFSLRSGIGYELSPVTDRRRTLRLPDDDRLWLSAGASYRLSDRFSFDLGYSFVHVFDGDVDNAEAANQGSLSSSGGRFTADVDANVHVISTALKMKFGFGGN